VVREHILINFCYPVLFNYCHEISQQTLLRAETGRIKVRTILMHIYNSQRSIASLLVSFGMGNKGGCLARQGVWISQRIWHSCIHNLVFCSLYDYEATSYLRYRHLGHYFMDPGDYQDAKGHGARAGLGLTLMHSLTWFSALNRHTKINKFWTLKIIITSVSQQLTKYFI
jgi:hypothetical protein